MDREELELNEELEKEILRKVENYAREKGIKLNPDRKIVEILIKGLVRNKLKFGEAYCPCRVVTGDPEKDKLIICPCAYHEEELKKYGKCHCGLFVK